MSDAPIAMPALEGRLAAIADRLEAIDVEREALYVERLTLWQRGIERGLGPVFLARCSRIRPVTVRGLLARHREE